MTAIQLIGAPTDIGASMRGSSMGPEALRIAQLQSALEQQGFQVIDSGNLSGPANPTRAAEGGYRHLHEVIAWNRLVHQAVLQALEQQRLPLLMGGDHCLAIGSIGAVARHCAQVGKKLIVLWLDAHADANTSHTTPTGNLHGMPVACLLGHGPAELIRMGPEDQAALRPPMIRQIGIRSVDAGERRHLKALGLCVYDMRHIDENGMRLTMEQALSGLDADTHLHVSFDVDFLDPSIAPGVGTAVRGGPTYRETQLCMEMIADTAKLGSLDIMELNPACDVRNGTAELMVEFLESLFGKSTLLR